MFSQTVEYALRAVVYLSYKAPNPCTTEEIAGATFVPKAYLSKVLQGLSRAGIVLSQRGIRGGMSLSRKPEELTVLEVVNSVDPIKRIKTCPLGISTHGAKLCPLHRRLDESLASVEETFATTTLAEILADPNGSTPLCEEPNQFVDLQLNPPQNG